MSLPAPAATPRSPLNPWMIALTVMWSVLLGVALLLLVVGGGADSFGFVYLACAGVITAVAVVVIGVQLGVGALRWHLDPSSRVVPVPTEFRPARQDF